MDDIWDYNSEVPTECTECGKTYQLPTRLLVEGGHMECPNCGANIEVTGINS